MQEQNTSIDPRLTAESLSIPASTVPSERPETFRPPKRGGDPYFGLTRSWYYKAEADGLLRLIRLRSRGKQRGVTLVPYDDVAALIAAAKLG